MGENEKEEPKKTEQIAITPEEINKELEETAPPEIIAALKGAPPNVKKSIIEMGMFRSMGPMPQVNPLIDKFTPEHVDKFLDYSHDDDKNAYKFQSSNRNYHLAYILAGMAFLVFLIIYLGKDQQTLLTDIIRMLILFAGGFGSGFGVKSYLDRKK